MTFFNLQYNKDVFITRVETNPEYNLIGDISFLTDSIHFYFCGDSGCGYLEYKDYYNTGSIQHSYYSTTVGDSELQLTSSITFYNNVSSTSSMAGVIKLLDSYYFVTESFGSGSGFYGQYFDIISIPKSYYGESFKNFVSIEMDPIHGQRIIYDDNNGNVFCINSITCCGPFLVGKAFYEEGIIYLRSDPSLVGHSITYPIFSGSMCCELNFTGSNHIYVLNSFCHVNEYKTNFSQNESAYTTASSGDQIKLYSGSDDRVFYSAMCLYDSDYNHIATCKFSKPIRKKPSDKLLFKIRLDLI